MRRWAAFVVPFLLIFGVGLGGVAWWSAGDRRPSGPPEVVSSLGELDPATQSYVSVPGMAHYTATVLQESPETLVHDAETWYLFGIFPPYETDDRAIRVLVRTTQEPERFVSYELMVVTGRLTRATPDKVPYDVEIQLGRQSDYFFTDDVLLIEADEIGPYVRDEWEDDPAPPDADG